jgi:hypothetical protein
MQSTFFYSPLAGKIKNKEAGGAGGARRRGGQPTGTVQGVLDGFS